MKKTIQATCIEEKQHITEEDGMFMMSKVQLLWRDVERARRVQAIQAGMDDKDLWKNTRVFDPVQAAEDKFAREVIFVYPDLIEYFYEMEKRAYDADDKIRALQQQINTLKEVPKKVRKPRAKKVKE